MNYILGPMRCSGKQRLYPSEFEQQDEKMEFRSENISVMLQSSIENATETLRIDSENWKQEMTTLKIELNDIKLRVSEQDKNISLDE